MNSFQSFWRRIALSLVLMFMAVGIIASPTLAFADTVSVTMGGGPTMLGFVPAEVTISPGDTIHFEVGPAAPHNVVFDPANAPEDLSSLSHDKLEMAGGFDVTFPADVSAGTYDFYCLPHRGAGMLGKVIVQ